MERSKWRIVRKDHAELEKRTRSLLDSGMISREVYDLVMREFEPEQKDEGAENEIQSSNQL